MKLQVECLQTVLHSGDEEHQGCCNVLCMLVLAASVHAYQRSILAKLAGSALSRSNLVAPAMGLDLRYSRCKRIRGVAIREIQDGPGCRDETSATPRLQDAKSL